MSLNQRKDKRTSEQFSEDLKKYHKIEKKWSEIQKLDWINKEIYDAVDIISFGSDDEGKVWESDAKQKSRKPDYIFRCYKDGAVAYIHIIEIKAHPSVNKYPYFTYKVGSFKNCIKYNGTIITPLKDCKLIFTPKAQKWILKNFDHKIYFGFSPNNKAVRIQKKDLEELIKNGMVKKIPWHSKTIEEIDKHNFLFT